jgi:hypothetical protein
MVKAEAHQGINEQALRFDAFVALLTDSKCSLIDLTERRVHSCQELRKRGVCGGRMQGCMKALAALFQFGAKIGLFGSDHRTSCHRLLFRG